jgi:hypothetical protein
MKYSLMIVFSILVLVLGSGVVNAQDIGMELYNGADVTKYFGFNGTLYSVESMSGRNITLYGVDPEIEVLNTFLCYSNDRTRVVYVPLFRVNYKNKLARTVDAIAAGPSRVDPEGIRFCGRPAPDC